VIVSWCAQSNSFIISIHLSCFIAIFYLYLPLFDLNNWQLWQAAIFIIFISIRTVIQTQWRSTNYGRPRELLSCCIIWWALFLVDPISHILPSHYLFNVPLYTSRHCRRSSLSYLSLIHMINGGSLSYLLYEVKFKGVVHINLALSEAVSHCLL
jgi:hypothetical protein